jgi:biopolymer transport protein ExbD
MAPTEILLPITPMLDMSFQLLFFFICIYKPPLSQEAQFLIDLTPARVKKAAPLASSGENSSPSSSSTDDKEDPFDKKDPPRVITLTIRIHEDKDDHFISNIVVDGLAPKFKKLFDADPSNTKPFVLIKDPPADFNEWANRDKELLDKLPQVIDAVKAMDAPEGIIIKIKGPPQIRMFKIVSIMDKISVADAGFGMKLEVDNR